MANRGVAEGAELEKFEFRNSNFEIYSANSVSLCESFFTVTPEEPNYFDFAVSALSLRNSIFLAPLGGVNLNS